MTVKKLISELRKVSGKLDVGVAAHDNYEEECAGWVCCVLEFDKEDYDIDNVYDKAMFKDMPGKCIILRC
jgi:hypothetical protein